MGLDYMGEVFFGACVKRTSRLGNILEGYIDRAGSTPASAGVPDVEIVDVGSQPTGDLWMVVRAVGSGHSFGKNEDPKPPVALVEGPTWRMSIAAFFQAIGEKDPPPVGWHFAGSVW